MHRRSIYWGVAAVSLLAIATALFFWLRPGPLIVMHPRVGHAITAVYGSGTVEAAVMMPVAPRVGARIVELDADEGADVTAGQRLAQLENKDMASNIAQLVAQERFAAEDFKRDATLLKDGAVARQTYDRAKAAWDTARAAVAQAQAQTGFMALVSPGNCYVIQRDGEIGQYIAANTPVFWISCNGALRVSAQIDEEDVPLVRPGQKVLIRADAFPQKVFEGRVTSLTPKGDPIGRSYRVRIALPAGCPLRIGMTTESNIISRDDPSALLLPESAISNGAVWRVVNGQAAATPVVMGAKNGDWVEIRHGLARTDIVVANAADVPASHRLAATRMSGGP
ncbi:MAG TPA: efflux RND transporter periplasmic adaptor subunit [Rhizomicrobium sp.]